MWGRSPTLSVTKPDYSVDVGYRNFNTVFYPSSLLFSKVTYAVNYRKDMFKGHVSYHDFKKFSEIYGIDRYRPCELPGILIDADGRGLVVHVWSRSEKKYREVRPILANRLNPSFKHASRSECSCPSQSHSGKDVDANFCFHQNMAWEMLVDRGQADGGGIYGKNSDATKILGGVINKHLARFDGRISPSKFNDEFSHEAKKLKEIYRTKFLPMLSSRI